MLLPPVSGKVPGSLGAMSEWLSRGKNRSRHKVRLIDRKGGFTSSVVTRWSLLCVGRCYVLNVAMCFTLPRVGCCHVLDVVTDGR